MIAEKNPKTLAQLFMRVCMSLDDFSYIGRTVTRHLRLVCETVYFRLVCGLSIRSSFWLSSIAIRSTENDFDFRRFFNSA